MTITDLTPSLQSSKVERAIADIAAGKPVIVVDDEDRENEGDLIFAAEMATPELLAFMVRYTSGFVCVSLPEGTCRKLRLPPMYPVNEDARGTAYTVTVDAVDVGTGISATDRARTIRLLADPAARPSDFNRPGHVVPLRARMGGVLARPGHTEAAGDLARLAGLQPVGVLCEIVSQLDSTEMAHRDELKVFAQKHDLAMISIAELISYRQLTECHVDRIVETRMPFECGTFRAFGYSSRLDEREHIALVYGDVGDGEGVLVRVHSECLTGDVFGSLRCDCGPQLQASLETIVAEGRGVVLYVRGHEGRGIGLLRKLEAYNLQDGGADTVEANIALGLPVDARDYAIAAQILRDLGVSSLCLLSNNPGKQAGLRQHGLRVDNMRSLVVAPNPENVRYVNTKTNRMGHLAAASMEPSLLAKPM
ncbi:bifunctional 3,4-dihydroxy-2-butanone-4-phosphate synthase/GTP cyclohydrolase II [Prescottella agglutinans]|uniref:Riboflavin biosynthesis protein RibBA n=1 Tax=Prescottella agglutinans TaxID=1644129 RepID=A0A438B9Y4_9NOCA|nr:bifunctional 3,4-dihydroxy-2-butanone-4-phosphate synthase/GTP cyclohydrolase II [Prescottella agglutinans]RVW07804.1 bifunctional 3,4-dihydroxy-2-butanone-4-phosphate synthase/GTP cyclohydrolase II [Prescottella agglutinans]